VKVTPLEADDDALIVAKAALAVIAVEGELEDDANIVRLDETVRLAETDTDGDEDLDTLGERELEEDKSDDLDASIEIEVVEVVVELGDMDEREFEDVAEGNDEGEVEDVTVAAESVLNAEGELNEREGLLDCTAVKEITLPD
jgi:hypothetical protein